MVSVPQLSLGNSASWAAAELPSNENKDVESMIKAGLYGTAITQQKQEIAKTKQEELDKKKLEELRGFGVDRWSNKDRKGMATVINEMAVISPDAAKNFKDALFNLDKTDAFRAGMALYAAAASSSDKAQVEALKQSKDIFSMTSVPFAEGTQDMIDTPYGPERDKKMMDAVAALQGMGILPAPKDVFGTPTGASGSDGVHSVHFFDDGSAVGVTKDKKSVYFDAEGNELTGEARKIAIDKARKSGVDIEAMKKEAVESAKAKVTNYQDLVSTGKNAADNLPDILTSLDLLQRVKTGGWEGAKLRVKNFLGVESEDEATLTNLMAENMLKKLRPTFGGAFSAQETKFMENISAGIKKSGPGNIGVYKQVADKYRFYINRAMKEAEIKGDKDTVRYLQYSLDRMDQMFPKKGTPASAQQATPAATPQLNVPAAVGQPMPGAGRPLPPMEKGTTAKEQELHIMRRAEEVAWEYGIMPEALLYNRKTGEYGYRDEKGEFVPLRVPTP